MITLLNKFDDNYVLEKKDVLDVICAYIKENHLESFLNDVIFDDNSKYMGSYNAKDRIITLNDNKIIKFCYKNSDKIQKLYNIDENLYTYFFNFYYLYIIYHELEHVIQTREYFGNGNLMYKYLYELCRKLHYNSQIFYNRNHDLFPIEIDANNNGYLKAYQILSYTKLPGKELRIMQAQYLFSLLFNYEKINNYKIMAPIDKLCNENKKIDRSLINKLIDACNLSKIERLNMGLDITPNEYDSIYKEKLKIKKYK